MQELVKHGKGALLSVAEAEIDQTLKHSANIREAYHEKNCTAHEMNAKMVHLVEQASK